MTSMTGNAESKKCFQGKWLWLEMNIGENFLKRKLIEVE